MFTIMDNDTQLQRIADLERIIASLRSDVSALEEATQKIVDDRDRLQARVAELQVTNKRLVDMLWGRRSERRVPDSGAPLLP
jgi:chromosome segregation ATPase